MNNENIFKKESRIKIVAKSLGFLISFFGCSFFIYLTLSHFDRIPLGGGYLTVVLILLVLMIISYGVGKVLE